ncbi:MAG: ATP synthase F1 subunit gamma [Endomicrobium sp.]|jgi:F-type H+-transporting ATPase subunit gamma|nr:ATP synthase F1 subunit gamma [Endomicrobium sp.]
MAQNLQQLKKRIKTSNNIAQIAKVMEMIAASKIRKAQELVEKYNPYAKKIKYMIQKILTEKNFHEKAEKFLKKRDGKRLVYIISPDKGLCGSLVANIFKKVIFYIVQSEDYIVTVGKKATNNAVRHDYNILASFNMGTNFPKYDDMYPVIDMAKKFYFSDEVTKISVIYTKFKSMLVQEPTIEEIFPIKSHKNFKENEVDYIFEPNSEHILRNLLPYYIETEFYSALTNAYASEQAARVTAMKNAKDNANEISTYLASIYNKSRQEKITNEILDLANGQQGI